MPAGYHVLEAENRLASASADSVSAYGEPSAEVARDARELGVTVLTATGVQSDAHLPSSARSPVCVGKTTPSSSSRLVSARPMIARRALGAVPE